MRLKFETKLNNMHSAHRDLESKYKRVLNDYALSQKTLQLMTTQLSERSNEVTALKTLKAENESKVVQ